MELDELLLVLNQEKIVLRRNGTELTVSGDRRKLTAELMQELRAHKSSLIGLIDKDGKAWSLAPVSITPAMLTLVEMSEEEIERVVSKVAGGAANVQDIYPLAPLQEGILFHYLLGHGGSVDQRGDPYMKANLYGFESRDRLDEYLNALQAVIERHDILRTAVIWEGLREPVQVVWRKASLRVEEVKLEAGTEDAAKTLYECYHPRQYRMDLHQPPLLRVYVAEDRNKSRWLMMVLLHHLLGDHTTLDVMQEEVEAYLLGEGQQLTEPPPFRNLVAQALLGMSRDEHEAYFRRLLVDVEEPTVPFGLLNVRGDGQGIEEATRKVDEQLERRIRKQARNLGVSTATLCHVAWARLLAVFSECMHHVVFGTVLFGRMQGGEGAIRGMGMFMNTLPVKVDVGKIGIQECVLKTHRQLAELLLHEHAPLALAQRCSSVPAPHPLFSSLLNYRFAPLDLAEKEETRRHTWKGVRTLIAEERTNYPLTLSMDDLGRALRITVQVEQAVGAERVCEYMHQALRSLVEALESEPQRAIGTLEVLSQQEREQVLYGWNCTTEEFSSDRCVHELFEERAAETPDRVAVVFEASSLSYGELNRRANRLAHTLRNRGVGPEARVGVCMERSLEMIVALLATMKAGGAYVPLDPEYPVERLRYMLEDSAPTIVLTEEHLHERLLNAGVASSLLDITEAIAEAGDSNLDAASVGVLPEHLAYVIYTSGSTGSPKGVMVSHGNVARLLAATHPWFGFNSDDVWTFFHSYAFDFSVWEIWGCLSYAGRLVVVPRETTRSPEDFYQLLCSHQVTVLNQTPSAFGQLVAAQVQSQAQHQLRYVIFGGEALEVASLAPWYERVENQRTQLVNMYGITETTVHVTYRPLRRDEGDRRSPIGSRIPDLRTYILETAWGEPAPVGVSGELYVGGAGVARGYQNRAGLTAERFVPDPYGEPGSRLYRTGDLAKWRADGALEYLGRNDFQVKIRGFRIELGEIESRLREHSGVRDAVVIAREDTPGDTRLVAYYTSHAALLTEDLRAHMVEKLPEYMVPSAFVHLEQMPLTSNGKLDRKALPAPDTDAYVMKRYEEPVGETESALAAVWAEVLKIDQVGRLDNFFELGGHSLLAVRVIEQMRRAGLHADVRTIFAMPTLKDLAASLGSQSSGVAVPPNRIPPACEAITPEMLPLVEMTQAEIEQVVDAVAGGAANVQDIYPLAPLQEGFLFHYLMGGEGGDPYLLSGLTEFESRARLDSYLEALQAVIDRHDILRTAIVWEGLREPVQVVWRKAILPVEEVELAESAEDAARQLYERFTPRLHRIDIRQAPLLRVYVAEDREKGQWLMMQVLHHLSGDHTTLDVMQEEVEAYLLGEGEQLAEPLPFRNLVTQARLGVSREEHEAYFRRLLGDVEEPTAPFGLLNVQGDGRGIEQARLRVDQDLGRRLREQARRLGVSAASLCHVAYGRMLEQVSGRSDVVFGTVLFGRMQGGENIERVMGMFINTLPVRIKTSEEGVEKTVRGMHRQLTELLQHEHAPLALAQRCSAVPAPQPLFSSLLNYRYAQTGGEVQLARRRQALQGIRTLRGEVRTSYSLMFAVDDLGEDFGLTAQIENGIEARRVCEYMHQALRSLVEALETEPGRVLETLEVLPESEREQVLYGWNSTAEEFSSDRCVHELFEEQAARTPDSIAVVFEESSLSYGELNRRANQLAHTLRNRGVGPESRVGICMQRGLEMMVALLATMKAGGAYVPLDPEYPVERLRYMLEDSTPTVVLTQQYLKKLISGMTAELLTVELSGDGDVLWKAESESNPEAASVGLLSEHPVYVIYTSGTTGKPKGVVVEHRQLINYTTAISRKLGIEEGWRFGLVSTLTADLGNTVLFPALLNGGSLHLLSAHETTDADVYKNYSRRHGLECVKITPSHLQALLIEGHEKESIPERLLVFGGEPLGRDLVQRVRRLHPGCRVYNHYGPTECTIGTLSGEVSDDGQPALGRPIANTRTYVLDDERSPVPVGVSGELYIGGAGVARGYLNRADLTAERFVPNFHGEPGARMYRTGDLGRWLSEGEMEFLGRNDFQVKVRGFRIELGEIESRLREHGGVREAVVIAREDTPGDTRLVAYYTSGTEVEAEAFRLHVEEKLPEYMVPSAYVHLEQMPLTPNGKLDRRALPTPDTDGKKIKPYEEPVGETESALAAVWAEVLKVERVGRLDNFFELGGHSLLAVRVIARLRRTFKVEATIVDLFSHPVLASLAERLLNLQMDQFDSDQLNDVLNLMRSTPSS